MAPNAAWHLRHQGKDVRVVVESGSLDRVLAAAVKQADDVIKALGLAVNYAGTVPHPPAPIKQ